MFGLFLVFCALFLFLALFSYNAGDPSLNYVKSGVTEASNKAGLFGAYIAGMLNDHFGIGSFVWPCVFLALAAAHISPGIILHWWRWAGFFLLTLFFLVIASALDLSLGDLAGGGMLGNTLHAYSVRYLSPAGSFLLWAFVALAGIQLAANFSWIAMTQNFLARLRNWRNAAPAVSGAPGSPGKPGMPRAKRFVFSFERVQTVFQNVAAALKKLAASFPQKSRPAMPAPHLAAANASGAQPLAAGIQPPAFDPDDDDPFAPSQELRPESANAAPGQSPSISEPASIRQSSSASASCEAQTANSAPADAVNRQEERQDKIQRPEATPAAPAAIAIVDPESASATGGQAAAQTASEAEQRDEAPSGTAPLEVASNESDVPRAGLAEAEQPQAESGEPEKKTSALMRIFQGLAGGHGQGKAEEAAQAAAHANAPEPMRDARLFTDPAEIVFPSPELLNPPKPMPAATPDDLQAKGRALMQCFSEFDIAGELAGITPGPVVTMFEVRPAPGIRVSKIANLADDLSRSLKAVAVRIQAPIPGSDTVGIEIPNELRETVNFRELAESPAFTQDKGPLTMILGKTIAGEPFMADLTRMPHMLVAGATGAGKSVCLNSILVSLLFRMPPAKMRLLLVDPKRIELAVYADLPHLVHPVVTEMDDAKNALDWAVQDMKNRYKTFERMGVRNIVAYHQKLESFGGNPPPGLEDMVPLPYMVIVIDELADLMMTAAREVETSIVRLAQLARAAGIHMILATQRPSVDVVTGLIKANFPCRISFQVTSKHDSRTILDQTGAEHLLGRGDMLFKPSGGKLQRLHGPFLTDEEVQAVASHWKAQLPAEYSVDFSQWSAEQAQANPAVGGDATTDALYSEARDFVLDQGRASISLLQRHLKIGFNRAARLMEQFERDGIIGPADGSKPRNVIR